MSDYSPSNPRARRLPMASRKNGSASPGRGFPQWREQYRSAMGEADHKTLFKRIEVAEATMLARRDVLAQNPDGSAEQRKIERGLAELDNLKKEVLKFV
jgi:hypothetical protein